MDEANEKIREEIKNCVPGRTLRNSAHGFHQIVILLFGLLGHGKSSLINSCMCALNNEDYQNRADSGDSVEGRTKQRKCYDLADAIVITDNRGFSKMRDEEMLEACAQLRNLRPFGLVNWEKDNSEETTKRIPQSYQHPKAFYLPVIVQSCLGEMSSETFMGTLSTKCYEITGVHPIAVITKAAQQNARAENPTGVRERFARMGIAHTIALENYTEANPRRNPEADNQFLVFLDMCIKEAERGIKLRENQDYSQTFAKYAADQSAEERLVREKQWRGKEDRWKEEKKKLEKDLATEREKWCRLL